MTKLTATRITPPMPEKEEFVSFMAQTNVAAMRGTPTRSLVEELVAGVVQSDTFTLAATRGAPTEDMV